VACTVALMEEYRDEELERIRQRKLSELQRRMEEERARALEQAQRRAALRRILTPEAMQRLDNVRIVRPELAEALESQLIALAQSGRLKIPVTDEELRNILASIYERTRRSYRFKL